MSDNTLVDFNPDIFRGHLRHAWVRQPFDKYIGQHAFGTYWSIIELVWRDNRHCMFEGCGRDTFRYWVKKTLERYNCWDVLHHTSNNFWRRVLMEGVKQGFCTKSQSRSGHSQFHLRD